MTSTIERIVSFASQNPERQRELAQEIAAISAGRIEIRFAETEEAACALLPGAQVLLAHRFTPRLYEAGPDLKWVHLSSAGVDHSLFKPFTESKIVLTNSRGLHAQPMAEWVIAALLYWSQQFVVAEEWRRSREWSEPKKRMTRERRLLGGLNALVVGYGEVGKGIARMLRALDLTVEAIATTERKSDVPVYSMLQLEERLEVNDVVVLALPATPRTRGLFNHRIFPLMKDGSVLVNVARGSIVDEQDLIAALKEGKPAHALLDVFATEPLTAESELFSLPNVFMTPHVSGNFPEYTHRVHEIFIENLSRCLNDVPLQFVVDKQRGY